MMPRLDGFELLRALRSHPDTSGIPVILLSARAGEESSVEGLEAGADDYLVKPFTSRELLARVDTHLRLARMRRETAALYESELRFRSMADCAPVLMWTCGMDQRCDYFNTGWLDFTGRTKEEEIGRGWIEGIHADDLAHVLTVFDGAFTAQRGFTLEYRLRRRDGQYGWMLGTGAPRFLPGQEFFGYIGASIDISDFKRAQEEIRGLNERLEFRVAERTEQLATANRQLEAFGSSISHDLRAPLRRIQAFAAILAEDYGPQLDETAIRHLDSVRQNAKNMNALINALLDMGRLKQRWPTL